MNRNLRRFALLFATIMALNGCSRAPYVHLLNNVGRTVQLLSVSAEAGRINGWFFGLVWIGNQSGRDVLYRAPGAPVGMQIGIGRCRLWYTIPDVGDVYNYTTIVQLEPDRRLYLVDTGVWDAQGKYPEAVQEFPKQPEGFPVEP